MICFLLFHTLATKNRKLMFEDLIGHQTSPVGIKLIFVFHIYKIFFLTKNYEINDIYDHVYGISPVEHEYSFYFSQTHYFIIENMNNVYNNCVPHELENVFIKPIQEKLSIKSKKWHDEHIILLDLHKNAQNDSEKKTIFIHNVLKSYASLAVEIIYQFKNIDIFISHIYFIAVNSFFNINDSLRNIYIANSFELQKENQNKCKYTDLSKSIKCEVPMNIYTINSYFYYNVFDITLVKIFSLCFNLYTDLEKNNEKRQKLLVLSEKIINKIHALTKANFQIELENINSMNSHKEEVFIFDTAVNKNIVHIYRAPKNLELNLLRAFLFYVFENSSTITNLFFHKITRNTEIYYIELVKILKCYNEKIEKSVIRIFKTNEY